jgi:DNA-binding winged helix-turn-helix (wHTH) protein
LEFRILGPLQVLVGDEPLPLGGAKQRSTLAMLLLSRNQVVSRDRLIDGVWGASPPPSAGPTLETYVSRLRRAIPDDGRGDRLVTQAPGYRLRVDEHSWPIALADERMHGFRLGVAAETATRPGSQERPSPEPFHASRSPAFPFTSASTESGPEVRGTTSQTGEERFEFVPILVEA